MNRDPGHSRGVWAISVDLALTRILCPLLLAVACSNPLFVSIRPGHYLTGTWLSSEDPLRTSLVASPIGATVQTNSTRAQFPPILVYAVRVVADAERLVLARRRQLDTISGRVLGTRLVFDRTDALIAVPSSPSNRTCNA